ncbi:MAG: FAD-binding oxidoreductase [Candidatus Thorarchaeota archaeon]
MENDVIERLTAIVGKENISSDASGFSGNPKLVVRPGNADHVQQIVKLANEHGVFVVPVSSGKPRIRGTTAAKSENTIAVDLRRMKRILRIDNKNRVAMVEAGVTFGEFIPELEKQGLRPLMPLLPKAAKSVVSSALDQEPITTPRFHWDSPDPLLCTETIFGTGDLFRTGAAAGPGTLEEQWDSGQAQKNPMGPSQFDPYRILQGSQGTIGIVSWASIKCESRPNHAKAFLVGSKKLEDLFDFVYVMLRRKLADHLFILNSLSVSAAMKTKPEDIADLSHSIPEWILVLSFSGKGLLEEEELEYRIADARDIANENGVVLAEKLNSVSSEEIHRLIEKPSAEPYWKMRYRGACREVFFLTTLDTTADLLSQFLKTARELGIPEDSIGVYLQPSIQGTNTHCFFDIYYNPDNSEQEKKANSLFLKGSQALMDKGAYFSRPVPAISDSVFARSSPEAISAMKRVKAIFDPRHVMSPGNLCFKEGQ